MRVRGNAHQVFDKYQALAREAAASGDRIMAEAYWQYADHYFRLIQAVGGFGQRNNQGWGDGGEEGQGPQQQAQGDGQPNQANGNGHAPDERPDTRSDARPEGRPDGRRGDRDERRGGRRDDQGDSEPGLGGVAFLQNGRNAPGNNDPAADEQPEVPEYTPGSGRGRN